MKEFKIELRSPKIDEIISSPPGFLLKFGSSLILITIIIIIIFSVLIKIPEYVTTDAMILKSVKNAEASLIITLKPGHEFVVKKNQVILINIPGLSEFKYGRIVCKISDIKDKKATCDLKLPLETNYKVFIPLEANKRVKVSIMVDKQSIFSKIMGPLKFYFKNFHSYL